MTKELRKRGLYWGALVVVLLLFVMYEQSLGLTYPSPWPDEGLFLWQALAVRDTGTLLAPELCERREIFFMPPGYMVWHGLLFKLTGFSLQWARTLSALYTTGTLIALGYLARRFRARYAVLFLFIAFLTSPICRLASNTARMETLVALIGAIGLVFLDRGRVVAGFASLALAPLVHPNGVFVILLGIVFAVCKRLLDDAIEWSVAQGEFKIALGLSGRLLRFSWRYWELVLLALSAAAWLIFAVHFAKNSKSFVWDLAVQLHWKQNNGDGVDWWARLRRGENAVPALLLLGAVPLLARFARHALPFFALAAAFIARSIATTGWLYEYYTALGFLSLAIMLVEVAACSLGASFRMRTWQSAALTGYLGLSVASALFLVSSQLPALRESDRHATVDHRMWLRRYWTAGDRAAIAGYLRAAAKQPGGPHRVYFVPEADALLFEDLRNPNLSFVQPTQCTYRPADIVILHESPWTRAHVTTMGLVSTGVKHGIEAPLDKWQVLRSRVGGERWLAYPPLPVQAAQARQNLL